MPFGQLVSDLRYLGQTAKLERACDYAARQLGADPASLEVQPDPRRALARARELAGPEGAVLATGSIYLVADLLRPPGARRASML